MLGLSVIDAADIDSNVETQKETRAQHRLSESILTQLTVNEYLPGQGIAQHIDTETCFGPDIYILNMGCAITMTLQEQKKSTNYTHNLTQEFSELTTDSCSSSSGSREAANDDTDPDYNNNETAADGTLTGDTNNKASKVKKHLWLPARSLLILKGDSRYLWSHGIAPRTTDKVIIMILILMMMVVVVMMIMIRW
jgi:hypothetical protein